MTKRFADNIKHLREAKNVSQEKMAQAMNVSYQAVSKWETGKSLPDITLLPLISRYFGITIDELLMAEQLDEKLLLEKYETEAEYHQREGKNADNIPLWQEALQRMPNNEQVKVHLMAAYYDTDKVRYSKEIVELCSEIYRTADNSWCCGRAIQLIARTYAAVGNSNKAFEWASKAHSILNAAEFLEIDIDTDIEMMWANLRFATYWFQMHLFYAAMKMGDYMNEQDKQSLYQSVADAFDALTPLSRQDEDLQYKRHVLDSLMEE